MNTSDNTPRDFYELLEISPDATPETIHKAYLDKLKQWHPDKHPNKDSAAVKEAEEITKVLNQAYETLSDPKLRKQYDRMRRFTKGKKFEDYINDEAFQKKMKQAGPALKNLMEQVRDLYSLFTDAITKKYPLRPALVAMIGGGLLYFILPVDFIPDFLPLMGFLDDASVLAMIINALQKELEAYRKWKDG
jgi:uncharacterized membrane protein YkvA (DUF1232 family)